VVTGDGRWKLVLPHEYRTLAGKPGGRSGKPAEYVTATIEAPQLYDLQNDHGETKDSASSHPAMVARLLSFAEEFRDELGDILTGRKGRSNREPGRQ